MSCVSLNRLCLLSCLAVVAITTGCAQKQRQSEAAVKPLCMVNMDKVEFMKVAEDVLVGMQFAIEKADTESGVLRTRPLSGAQFFELWRSDNAGGFNTAEANLNSIRRTAELQVSEEASGELCVMCSVLTERLDIPEQKDITNSGRAYQLFSRSGQKIQKLELNKEQQEQMAWIDMGRDVQLETKILSRIEDHIASQKKTSASRNADKTETTRRKS
jgi:hypothetical protein